MHTVILRYPPFQLLRPFFDIALIGSTRWRNHSNHEVCGEAFCRVGADLVVMYMLLIDQDVSSSVNFAPYLLSMKHE